MPPKKGKKGKGKKGKGKKLSAPKPLPKDAVLTGFIKFEFVALQAATLVVFGSFQYPELPPCKRLIILVISF